MTATSIQSKNLTMKPISDNNLEMSSMTLRGQAKCEVMTSASMIDRTEKVLTCSRGKFEAHGQIHLCP